MGIIGSHVDITSGGRGHQANQWERCEWAEFSATFRPGREVELAVWGLLVQWGFRASYRFLNATPLPGSIAPAGKLEEAVRCQTEVDVTMETPRRTVLIALSLSAISLCAWIVFIGSRSRPIGRRVSNVALSRTGKWLAAGTSQGKITVWDQGRGTAPPANLCPIHWDGAESQPRLRTIILDNNSASASCLLHDRPFHGAPRPYDEPWRHFHDAPLLCYARLLPCGCPLESIFRPSKSQASYEPLDVIVRSSLPGRMAHSAITSTRVSLSRNPTEPLEPPSIRLADPFRPGRMRRIQVCGDQLEN